MDSDWHGSSDLCQEIWLPGFRLTRIIRSIPGVMTTCIQIDTDHQICAVSYDYLDSDWHGSSDLCRELWLPGFRLTRIIRSVPWVMTTWIQIDTDHQICAERYDYLDSDWHGSSDQLCAGRYDYLDSDWHSDWHGSSDLCREIDMTTWIQIDTDHQICAVRYDHLDSDWHGSLDMYREIWPPGYRLTRIIRSVPGDMTTWILIDTDHQISYMPGDMTTRIQIDTDHQISAGRYDPLDLDCHGSSDQLFYFMFLYLRFGFLW